MPSLHHILTTVWRRPEWLMSVMWPLSTILEMKLWRITGKTLPPRFPATSWTPYPFFVVKARVHRRYVLFSPFVNSFYRLTTARSRCGSCQSSYSNESFFKWKPPFNGLSWVGTLASLSLIFHRFHGGRVKEWLLVHYIVLIGWDGYNLYVISSQHRH